MEDLDHNIPTFWLKLNTELQMLILKKNFFNNLQTLPEYQNLIDFLCDLQQQQDLSDLQKADIGSFIPKVFKPTNTIEILRSDYIKFPEIEFFQFDYYFTSKNVYIDHCVDNSVNMNQSFSRALLQVALFYFNIYLANK